ncbi:hypothetical protein ABEG10_21580 [Burkholderia cenocepacia]|uniref:hypothetical protein n=1 Tax=Burkholderia cenocepacia TaxID=95486 RepID=UPI0020A03998|nr:hypothetical protein [Burkholderia cenocepacia]MCO8320801.1 hypothetical protein [Burkholderia cenocepacia]MCO8328085.1 hypothetical protein [Burkholderia cenocepacia]MCO8335372.1 hypothetical protein [Burkholderia cenocepacia]MCO8342656.1 hypothetical protein [Burkholderia cenocepacia]MCO8355938.1 hypothetical protein [Burkholderia cenocepacia]
MKYNACALNPFFGQGTIMLDHENKLLDATLVPGTCGMEVDGNYLDLDECIKLFQGGDSFIVRDGFVVRVDRSREPIQSKGPFPLEFKIPVIIEEPQ